jgi:seryl-tRNA synthetase
VVKLQKTNITALCFGKVLFIISESEVFMAKLTEKQKKKIVAEYIAGLSGEDDKKRVTHEELGRKYGVSETTIRNIIKADPDFAKKFAQIKKDAEEKATVEWEEFFQNLQPQIQSLMLRLMNLTDEDIQNASLKERAGFLKILAENFIVRNSGGSSDETPTIIEVVVEDASADSNT